jgi:hypothetical protein
MSDNGYGDLWERGINYRPLPDVVANGRKWEREVLCGEPPKPDSYYSEKGKKMSDSFFSSYSSPSGGISSLFSSIWSKFR